MRGGDDARSLHSGLRYPVPHLRSRRGNLLVTKIRRKADSKFDLLPEPIIGDLKHVNFTAGLFGLAALKLS